MNWRVNATCATEDPELWFPHSYVRNEGAAQTMLAVRICASCPVRAECLADAMQREGGSSRASRHGILGGLTPADRFRLYRRTRPKPASDDDGKNCGTPAGYQRHGRLGETACESCKAATAADRAKTRAAQRQQANQQALAA